jgi:SAM-dependent methyltransferase
MTAWTLAPLRRLRSEYQGGPGSPRFVQADFYSFEAAARFDVVCYWNGFGIGTDADQRRLLRLIRGQWLQPGGRAIIDVANSLVWAGWAGDISHRAARPDAGYQHALTELTDFDPVACRFTDTWWEQDRPERRHAQTGRCYTPADFCLLLEGTGLTLAQRAWPAHRSIWVRPTQGTRAC